MKQEKKGIRPQDVLILSKIISGSDEVLRQIDLAQSLGISQAEIVNALNRLKQAGLVDDSKKQVNKLAAIEFFKHAIKFLFPVEFGRPMRGIPTGPSAKFIKKEVKNDDFGYVWEETEGGDKGVGIKPIYPTVVKAICQDETLYRLMCLVDILRGLGGKRHLIFAKSELKKIIMGQMND